MKKIILIFTLLIVFLLAQDFEINRKSAIAHGNLVTVEVWNYGPFHRLPIK